MYQRATHWRQAARCVTGQTADSEDTALVSCQRYLACGVVEVEKKMQSSSHLEAMVKILKAQKDEPSPMKQQLEEEKEVSCEKNENDDMLDQVSCQDSHEDGCFIDDLLSDKLSIPGLVLRLVATMAVDHLENGECFLEGRESFRDYDKWSLQEDFCNSRVPLTLDELAHVLAAQSGALLASCSCQGAKAAKDHVAGLQDRLTRSGGGKFHLAPAISTAEA